MTSIAKIRFFIISLSKVRMASLYRKEKKKVRIIRDWSELPPELIESIAGTLDSIRDFLIFGAVCKSWRSAARSIGWSSIRQPPWLFSVDYSAHCLQLHDPWNPIPKTYTFPIPCDPIEDDPFLRKLMYAIGHGTACGCLLVLINGDMALFNPLLPDGSSWFTLPQLPKDTWSLDRFYPQILKYDNDTHSVIVSSRDEDDIHIPYCWRSGDPSWTKLCDDSVHQYTFHKGSFYLVHFTNPMIIVVDASNLTVTSRFPIPDLGEDCPLYLVESSSGELLMVTESNIWEYQVMQVDLSQQPPTFVKVDSIGEDALFVTPHHSVICFSAAKSKSLKRNCIYYYRWRYLYSLDIGDGSTRQESFVHEKADSWLIPALSFHP